LATEGRHDGKSIGSTSENATHRGLDRHVGRLATCILQRYTDLVAERKDPLDSCTGFQWDEGNAPKNWERHRVSPEEAEDVFFHEPLVVRSDIRHSKGEKRYYALGQTGAGRKLFVSFTIRRSLVRVVSVRDMNQKEGDAYAKHEEKAGA
jgi:uncharacterized DUF497 family protein